MATNNGVPALHLHGQGVPRGMIPGYVVIKPDFPECITDFGMLWFENETTISAASSWVLEANAAAAMVTQKAAADCTSGN